MLYLVVFILVLLLLFFKDVILRIRSTYSIYKLRRLHCKHGVRGAVYYHGSCPKCLEEEEDREVAFLLEKANDMKYKDEFLKQKNIKEKVLNNTQLLKEKIQPYYLKDINYLLNVSPRDFEHIISKVYEKLGFTTQVTPYSGDMGKDIIMYKNNRLYLVECKRYSAKNLVSREELQKLYAAIMENKAYKGFFVTTSDFKSTAKDYVKNIDNKIKLINGKDLLKLIGEAYPDTFVSERYNEVCPMCGEFVEFVFPIDKVKRCSLNHTVNSTIENLMK